MLGAWLSIILAHRIAVAKNIECMTGFSKSLSIPPVDRKLYPNRCTSLIFRACAVYVYKLLVERESNHL